MAKSPAPSHVTIVDGSSLFDACQTIAERFNRERLTIDYAKLSETLAATRRTARWETANIQSILLSIDPASESQQRFLSMVSRHGFEPDTIHFRDAFASLPPGKSPNDATSKSIVSFAARIAYIAGLLARNAAGSLLVVTHAFELCGPLCDLRQRLTSGHVGIAYFGSMLDYRWKLAGLLDKKLGIDFFDLDEAALELMGVDLAVKVQAPSEVSSGLRRF